MNTFFDYLDYMQQGGIPMQQSGQEDQIMQIIKLYAQITQSDPREIVQKLQALSPQEQQKALQQMVQVVEQSSQNDSQQEVPMQKMGGQSFNPGTYSNGYSGTYSAGNYFNNGGYIPTYAEYAYGGFTEIPYLFSQQVDRPYKAENGISMEQPKEKDFPDYESYSQALDQWIMSLQDSQPESQTSKSFVGSPSPYVPSNKLKDYNGVSIVDFLNIQGKPSDFNFRKQIASIMGINNYKGTASQNTKLLRLLQKNPDILSNYDGANTSPTGKVTKTVAKTKNAKAAPTTEEIANANVKNQQTISNQKEPASVRKADSLNDYFQSKEYSNNPFASYNVKNQASFNQSRSPLPRSGSKSDPYLRMIENDPRSQANINSRKRREFATNLAIGTFAPWLAEGALMAATTRYLPYAVQAALPEVTATARHASRALPYATRALPFQTGGIVLGQEMNATPELLQQLKKGGYNFEYID